MKVEDPNGQVWRVGRRWTPWRPRRRRVGEGGHDVLGSLLADDPAGLLLVVVLPFLGLGPLVLVLLVFGVEFLLVLLLLPFAVLVRVVFGRHWYVVLRRGWSPWTEQPAGNWQTSEVRIHEIAEGVRRGLIPVRSLNRPKPGARSRR